MNKSVGIVHGTLLMIDLLSYESPNVDLIRMSQGSCPLNPALQFVDIVAFEGLSKLAKHHVRPGYPRALICAKVKYRQFKKLFNLAGKNSAQKNWILLKATSWSTVDS